MSKKLQDEINGRKMRVNKEQCFCTGSRVCAAQLAIAYRALHFISNSPKEAENWSKYAEDALKEMRAQTYGF